MTEDIYLQATEAGVIPTPQQTLLLKACTQSGDEAIESFLKWVSTLKINFTDLDSKGNPGLPQVFDQLDIGSQRLLSLLYKNLSNQGYQHPVIQKLKGYYKYIWYRNTLLKAKLVDLVADFKAADMEVAVIKGIAQIEKYYPHYGMRPTIDIDLYVQPVNAKKAADLLIAKGWESKRSNPALITNSLTHAHTFYSGPVELDLHFHFSFFSLKSDTELLFWRSATRQNEGYFLLSPAHELFITLLHAFQWNPVPPVRWVTDSVNILSRFDDNEWDSFSKLLQSENYTIQYPLFMYLLENNFTRVPENIMNSLREKKIHKNIQMQVKYALTPKSKDRLTFTKRVYYRLRFSHKKNWIRKWLDHYLYLWGAKNYTYVFIFGLMKAYRKMINQHSDSL